MNYKSLQNKNYFEAMKINKQALQLDAIRLLETDLYTKDEDEKWEYSNYE